MTDAAILASVLCLCLGVAGGYFLGFYIRSLKTMITDARTPTIDIEEPSVVGGALEPPKQYGAPDSTSSTGLVETKTPQRLEWEAEQLVEKEGLRIAP